MYYFISNIPMGNQQVTNGLPLRLPLKNNSNILNLIKVTKVTKYNYIVSVPQVTYLYFLISRVFHIIYKFLVTLVTFAKKRLLILKNYGSFHGNLLVTSPLDTGYHRFSGGVVYG